ncbi:hypothetical protein GCM10011571_15640 [Marinithermofilum abyssi]|uniref:VTT domain-containing protein n=1 Tax=Marinithermofilum abyssi TaxID=1571185 RepID=A0A8J2VHC4_9BACL|nr:YqaA family protein [Marinithermofilum abyssi]GGE14993.1 hypothetical protein GCM10011571_15640 [Marinithermofilum abyssi]
MLSQWLDAMVQFFMSYGPWGLVIVSFTESSFFPIPPDVLLIPLSIAQPELALWYAFLTTASSVAGALLGWWIGRKWGRPVMLRFFSESTVQKVEGYFEQYGGFSLAIAGFTPIPYKVFTIASGICKVNIREVVLWSILGRGARFFLEGLLILWLGKAAQSFIQEYFSAITVSVVAVILLLALLYTWVKQSRAN